MMQNTQEASHEKIVTLLNALVTESEHIPKRFRVKERPHPRRHLPKILMAATGHRTFPAPSEPTESCVFRSRRKELRPSESNTIRIDIACSNAPTSDRSLERHNSGSRKRINDHPTRVCVLLNQVLGDGSLHSTNVRSDLLEGTVGSCRCLFGPWDRSDLFSHCPPSKETYLRPVDEETLPLGSTAFTTTARYTR